MSLSTHCVFVRGRSPIIAAAVHNGHDTRPDVDVHLAIDDRLQRREEDPVTGEWTQIARTQIVGLRSRFEVDLNRPREKAVYQKPEDAWGIEVWDGPPDQHMIETSLKEYDEFYARIRELLDEMLKEHSRVVVYDLHTYNQYRDDLAGKPGDPAQNPEVNIGTGTMDRNYWAPVVDRFLSDLRTFDYCGRHLDVRENIKFQGGYFGRWIHENYPRRACVIAIEFKKFFMDEWEGVPDVDAVESIYRALKFTLPGVRSALEKMEPSDIPTPESGRSAPHFIERQRGSWQRRNQQI